eukprot:CAMPEP_0180039238 /NCGR_PEP_ID=MMETSP0984-20121128/32732_1 /TAXON_ID=483367 /ORGANISM="non described non described, Strain CCMP 2436" /LENGTH=132 /DNA_ID=CAMNT_0021966223 /DNA_START=186 /DNA_END=581 /DNA_ORIENTATION=-
MLAVDYDAKAYVRGRPPVRGQHQRHAPVGGRSLSPLTHNRLVESASAGYALELDDGRRGGRLVLPRLSPPPPAGPRSFAPPLISNHVWQFETAVASYQRRKEILSLKLDAAHAEVTEVLARSPANADVARAL